MQLDITGRNIELTPALKDFALEKFQRLDRLQTNLGHIHLILQIENVTHITEGTFHYDGNEFAAKAEADDMYKAIDLLVDKLLAQLTKHKEKHLRH